MALRVFVDRISIPARSDGSQGRKSPAADNWLLYCLAAFWSLALVLGGAGADYPLVTMIVQAGAVVVLLALALRTPGIVGAVSRIGFVPSVIVLGILALPVVQLLPLPPLLWQSLPGRERPTEIYGLLGWRDAWLPLSLAPEATKAATLSLVPGIATFFAAGRLSSEQRRSAAMILVGVALFSALLGALQIATGGGFTPFDSIHRGHALGVFTNRNHQAQFLLITMPFVWAILSPEDRRRRGAAGSTWIAAGAILILSAAVLATKSRSGSLFLLVVLPLCAMQLRLLKFRAKTVAITLLTAGILLAVIASSSAVQDLLARFGNAHDDRMTFWANTVLAIKQSGIIGAGFGTFPTIYRTVEPLADLTTGYVNHAHSDYLELVLEGGLPAFALLLTTVGWIGARAVRLTRSAERSPNHKLAVAALVGLLIIILHSLVDYPLRMLSIEAVFGFLCALLIPPSRVSAKHTTRFASARWLCVAPALGCLYAIGLNGLAAHAVATDTVSLAEALSNRSAAAASYAAGAALDRNPGKAAALAELALRVSPLDASALSTLALAREKMGDDRSATALMNVAAGAGWWDDAAQIWMFDRARDVGRYDIAMERADALLRRETLSDVLFPILLDMTSDTKAAAALIDRLEERPTWRGDFLQWADDQDSNWQGLDRIWQMLGRSDAPPSTHETAIHVASLIRNHRYAEARQVWIRTIHTRSGSAVFDGDFTGASRPLEEGYVTPFQWSLSDEPAVTSNIDQPPAPYSGVALNVTVDPGFAGVIARQLIVLPPGSYRLLYAMLPVDSADAEAAVWSVRCVNSDHALAAGNDPERGARQGWKRMSFRFDIPVDCPAQWIELRGSGTALSSSELWYDRIGISRF